MGYVAVPNSPAGVDERQNAPRRVQVHAALTAAATSAQDDRPQRRASLFGNSNGFFASGPKLVLGWELLGNSIRKTFLRNMRGFLSFTAKIRFRGGALGKLDLQRAVRVPDRAAQGGRKDRGGSMEGKSADWKLAIAAELKRRRTVTNCWVARTMPMVEFSRSQPPGRRLTATTRQAEAIPARQNPKPQGLTLVAYWLFPACGMSDRAGQRHLAKSRGAKEAGQKMTTPGRHRPAMS